MIDFASLNQPQAGDSLDDPTQEMIRQAMAAANAQPTSSGQAPAGNNSAPPDPGERLSLGERIGKKTAVVPAKPAADPSASLATKTAPQDTGNATISPSAPPVSLANMSVAKPIDSGVASSSPTAIGSSAPRFPGFGSRLAPTPTASSPAPPVTVNVAPPDPLSVSPGATGVLAPVTAGLDAKTIPPPPSQASTIGDLIQQRAKLGAPLDRNAVDPATGKSLYKMGWGQRLLGFAANFGAGLAHQGPVEYIGPGATNHRYATDEADREKQVQNVDTQISDQEKLSEENRKLYEASTQGAYRQGLLERAQGQAAKYENAIDPNTIQQDDSGVWHGTSYGGDRKEVGEPAWSQKLSAQQNKPAAEPKTEAEIALALQTAKIKGDKQGVSKYQGALAELAKQKAAGREPKDTSAADVAKALQVAEFRSRETDKVDKAKEAERDKRYAELDKNVVLKYNPQKMAEQKAKIDADLETKHAPKYQAINDQADQMLGLTKAGTKLTSNNATPEVPSGDRVTGQYMGPDNPQKGLKHGQTVTLPKSQVQQATKLGHFKAN